MTITYNAPKTEVRYNFETKQFSIFLADKNKLNKCIAEINAWQQLNKEGVLQ